MFFKLSCLLLLLPYLAIGQDECDFSVAAVQTAFESFEEFRRLHAFDPTDSQTPVTKYSTYKSWDGYNNVNMKIPPFYISDNTKVEGTNKHLSMNGFSTLENDLHINYRKVAEGYEFLKPGQSPMFTVPLLDLDVDLSSSGRNLFSKEHLEIFDKIIALRKKLYAFHDKLENDNIKVSLYDVNPLRNGYFAQYHATGLAGGLAHSANNDEFDGQFSCGGKDQNYSVTNNRVELKGTPYAPIYH